MCVCVCVYVCECVCMCVCVRACVCVCSGFFTSQSSSVFVRLASKGMPFCCIHCCMLVVCHAVLVGTVSATRSQ